MKLLTFLLFTMAGWTSLTQVAPKDVLKCPKGDDYLDIPGAKFCSKCGQPLRLDSKETARLYYKTFFSSSTKQAGEKWVETRLKKLKPGDLKDWPDPNLQQALREIRARHCSKLDSPGKVKWYRPLLSRKEADKLRSEVERQNFELIVSEVKSRVEAKNYVMVKMCKSGRYLATDKCPVSGVHEVRVRRSELPNIHSCLEHPQSHGGGAAGDGL